MRITSVGPLALTALLVSCQGNESNTDTLAPPSILSSSIVSRDRIEGGTLIHTIPEHGISMRQDFSPRSGISRSAAEL
jgi:hypothetical protein